MLLSFKSVKEILSITTQMKAIEQYSIVPYNVFLIFESLDAR